MIGAVWFILAVGVGMMLGILLYHLKVLADNAAAVPVEEDFLRVDLIVMAAVVIAAIVIFPSVYYLVFEESVTDVPDEHKIYVNIRDANNCTKSNDTYCVDRSGCVHAYEHCQRMQCPGAFP